MRASNLMLLPEGTRRIPLDRILPYNEDDLLMFISPDVAIIIFSLMDDSKQVFSIKAIMMGHKEVYACTDYEKAMEDFGRRTLRARLERFFVTKKNSYIYFDKEEQDHLGKIFEKNHLSGFVNICKRNSKGIFEKISFESITPYQYRLVRTELRKLGIMYVITPERFMALKRVQKESESKRPNPFSFKEMMDKREMVKVNEVFKTFPDMNVRSKKSLKGSFRMLSKIHHPDVNGGKDKVFMQLKDDYEMLKNTRWFKNLSND